MEDFDYYNTDADNYYDDWFKPEPFDQDPEYEINQQINEYLDWVDESGLYD